MSKYGEILVYCNSLCGWRWKGKAGIGSSAKAREYMKGTLDKKKECRLKFPFPFPHKCLHSRLIYEQIN